MPLEAKHLHHEGGHAVLALLCGEDRLRTVEIFSALEPGVGGETDRSYQSADEEIEGCLAGPLAQVIYGALEGAESNSAEILANGRTDFQKALFELIAQESSPSVRQDEWRRYVGNVAPRLMSYWSGVRSVAALLARGVGKYPKDQVRTAFGARDNVPLSDEERDSVRVAIDDLLEESLRQLRDL